MSSAFLNAGKGRLWLSSVVFCACLETRSFSVEGEAPYTAFMNFLWQGLPGQASLSCLLCHASEGLRQEGAEGLRLASVMKNVEKALENNKDSSY